MQQCAKVNIFFFAGVVLLQRLLQQQLELAYAANKARNCASVMLHRRAFVDGVRGGGGRRWGEGERSARVNAQQRGCSREKGGGGRQRRGHGQR